MHKLYTNQCSYFNQSGINKLLEFDGALIKHFRFFLEEGRVSDREMNGGKPVL